MEYMDLLPPTAPSLVFAREICTPYWSGRLQNQAKRRRVVAYVVLSSKLYYS